MTEDKGKAQTGKGDSLTPCSQRTPPHQRDDFCSAMSKSESTNSGANYTHFLRERDGGKTSEAVSGSMAIKPTLGLCFLLLLAYNSNTGFDTTSDQTNEIFLKYYYNRRDTVEAEQRDAGNKLSWNFNKQREDGKTNTAFELD